MAKDGDDHVWQVAGSKNMKKREKQNHSYLAIRAFDFDPEDKYNGRNQFCNPHAHDIIFKKARAAVIEYNRSSLSKFCDPVRLEALNETQTTFTGDESNVEKVALVQGDRMHILSLKLIRSRATGKRDNKLMVVCFARPQWKAFSDVLLALELPSSDPSTGAKGWAAQRSWWSKNGKTFRIFDLPTELRMFLVKYLIGFRHHPGDHHDSKPFSYCGVGSEYSRKYMDNRDDMRIDPTMDVVPAPDMNILQAHPKLYYEMKDYIWNQIPKCFSDQGIFKYWIRRCLPRTPGQLDSLQYLHLDFDLTDYIDFFGVDVAPFHPNPTPDATLLSTLPALRTLRLRFPSTIRSSSDDPWALQGSLNGYSWDCDFQGNSKRDGALTSCQKVIIDWILTFAKQYIQHIPRILLTGYIKNSTKEKWSDILRHERHGMHHDMTEAKDIIRSWPRHDLPPRCECSSLCAFSGRSLRDHIATCHLDNCKICGFVRQPGGYLRSTRCWHEDYEFDYSD